MEVSDLNDQKIVELKRLHDDAYRIIENAIQLEETGKKEQALQQYQAGLEILDKALNINIKCPPNPDTSWEETCSKIQKMKMIRKEVVSKIAESSKTPETNLCSSLSPACDGAVSASIAERSILTPSQLLTYSELSVALQNLKVETSAQSAHILYICTNVQIYFISSDGTVKTSSEPDVLKIVELEDGGGDTPRAFLQVGEWIYPLVSGVSPCLKTEYGAIILPDLHSSEEGAAVGIALPEEAVISFLEILNKILLGIEEITPPAGASGRRKRDLSSNISQGIVRGAHLFSQGMVRGAEKAGNLMNYCTPKLMEHMKRHDNPTPINPKIQTGLTVAKTVTGGAVTVTGYIASCIGSATMALGRYLAPHIERQGTRLLSTAGNYSEQEAANKVGGVLQVAAGAMDGFSTVYDGLENAAKILGNSLTTNAVKIVQHRYGESAGAITGDTLYTVGNVFVAGSNIRHLTPKGIVKTTVKQTGKAVVEDYHSPNTGGVSQFNSGLTSEVD